MKDITITILATALTLIAIAGIFRGVAILLQ